MSLRLFMDEHVKLAVSDGLRRRGCDVLTAQEDKSDGLADDALLDRSAFLGRVIVAQDDDFLVEGARRQSAGERFAGIIYSHQMDLTIKQLIDELDLVAYCCEPADLENQIHYLPLR